MSERPRPLTREEIDENLRKLHEAFGGKTEMEYVHEEVRREREREREIRKSDEETAWFIAEHDGKHLGS